MLTRLLLIASLPLVLGADADNWKPFTSKEGGFTILFPGVPAESKQEAKAPTGTVTVTVPAGNQNLAGQFITATATDSANNTSEFSNAVRAT